MDIRKNIPTAGVNAGVKNFVLNSSKAGGTTILGNTTRNAPKDIPTPMKGSRVLDVTCVDIYFNRFHKLTRKNDNSQSDKCGSYQKTINLSLKLIWNLF